MVEFVLFAAAMAGAVVMVKAVQQQLSQPKMKAQPIKVEKEQPVRQRANRRYPY